jgi:formylglycine-generating enzyme required for sulfatase activity
MNRIPVCLITMAAVVLSGGVASAALISIPTVTVGDAGNQADTTGFGAVNYVYQIGKYDVTTSQYAAFLNAVAATDPYALYSPNMASIPPPFAPCGIVQNFSSGSYTYSVTPGHENFPVNYVSWGSAARFVNWLQNGQPTGPEGPGTTETGAYTLNGATTQTALMAVVRNSAATVFLPTENEWYKAAYYKGGSTSAGYWLYATQSNTQPSNTLPDTGNHANYHDSSVFPKGNGTYTDPTNYFTPVGAFALSPGPYGTFDQTGLLFQSTETPFNATNRVSRGGSFNNFSNVLPSTFRSGGNPAPAFLDDGFRVASLTSIPEPSTRLLAVLACGVIWCSRRRFKFA